MPNREIGGKRPSVAAGSYVDESALLIGDVTLSKDVSVWPCALLRADDDRIEVGEGSAIMDMAFVEAPEGRPVKVGRGCLVSHCARLHGCTLNDSVLVGIGATVLDGAEIGEGSIVAAGSLVPPGKSVPPGSVVAGVPASETRKVREADIDTLRKELGVLREKAGRYSGTARVR